ncbi:MAG: hypothetical protein VB118_04125 [Oscillospiraceae bacterium]|nr:hypothetical protein [Oscillospiraceae bacterium]
MKSRKGLALVAALLIAALSVFSLVSCTEAVNKETDTPEGYVLAENPAVDYNFYYPKGWILDKNEGMTGVYAGISDPSSVSVATFTPDKDFESKGLKSYVEGLFPDEYEKNFGNVELVGDMTEGKIGEYSAYSVVFKGDISGNRYQFKQTFCVHGGYLYIITYTALADNYELHLSEADAMVSYIKFK